MPVWAETMFQMRSSAFYRLALTAAKRPPSSLPTRASRLWLSSKTGDATNELVSTSINPSTGVAYMTMQHPPANVLSLEMCQSLSKSIKEVEQDSTVQALVLQSSKPSIFSAGLDIHEMDRPDKDRLTALWTSFQQVYLDLYGSRLACVAAVEGHALAGGCMLTMSCDYRVMGAPVENSKPASIGLNEAKFGLIAPPFMAKLMADTVGHRRAELSLSMGTAFSPQQALDIGLVDEVVPKDEVRAKAESIALQFVSMPPDTRTASKMMLREERLRQLLETRNADTDAFVHHVLQESVQQALSAYLASLKKPKQK